MDILCGLIILGSLSCVYCPAINPTSTVDCGEIEVIDIKEYQDRSVCARDCAKTFKCCEQAQQGFYLKLWQNGSRVLPDDKTIYEDNSIENCHSVTIIPNSSNDGLVLECLLGTRHPLSYNLTFRVESSTLATTGPPLSTEQPSRSDERDTPNQSSYVGVMAGSVLAGAVVIGGCILSLLCYFPFWFLCGVIMMVIYGFLRMKNVNTQPPRISTIGSSNQEHSVSPSSTSDSPPMSNRVYEETKNSKSGEELCTLTQVSFRHHVPGTSLERKGHDEVLEIKNVDANAGNKPFHQLDREEEPQLSDRPTFGEISEMAKPYTEHWKMLGEHLNVPIMEDIKDDAEGMNQVLLDYMKKRGFEITWPVFSGALDKVKMLVGY